MSLGTYSAPKLSLFPYPSLTIYFTASMFPNRLATKLSNNIPKNSPFCSFVSFSVALVMPFNKIL